MANEDRKDFIIRILADAAAANAARAEISKVQQALKDVENQGGMLRIELESIQRQNKLDRVAASMGALAKTTALADEQAVKLAQHLKDVNATPIEVSRAANTFANSAATAQAANNESLNIGRVGTAIRNLPSTPLPGGISSDAVGNLLRTGQALKTLSENSDLLKSKVLEAAKAVGLGNIGAIGAIAGLAVVIKVLQGNAEAAAAAAKKDLDARAAALRLIVEGDQQAIQSRLNVLKIEQDVRAAQKADADRLLEEYRTQYAAQAGLVRATAAEINAALGTNNGELIALKANSDQAAAALNASSVEFDFLSAATGKTALTTAQAAEAEKQLNLERGYASRVQQEASDALELLNLAATGSTKQVTDLIASKEREIEVYSTFKAIVDEDIKYLQENTEAYKSAVQASEFFGSAITRDEAALKRLTNFTLEAAEANDFRAETEKRAAEAAKDIDRVRAEIATNAAKQAEQLQSIASKTAAAYASMTDAFEQANLAQSARDLQQDAKRNRTNRDTEIKSAIETSAKIEDITAKRVDDYVASEERRADEIRKIQSTLLFNEETAAQERNVIALDTAQRAAKKATDEAEAGAKKDRKKADENSEKARKDLQRDLDLKAKLEAIARAAEIREDKIADGIEYSNRKAAYYREQDLLAAKNRAELLQQNLAYTKNLTEQQKFLKTIEQYDKAYYETVVNYAKGVDAQIKAILGGKGLSGSGVIGGVAAAPKLVPGAPGGSVTGGGGAGGFFGGSPQSSGFTFAPVINGVSKAGIIDTVTKELNETLKAAGYK